MYHRPFVIRAALALALAAPPAAEAQAGASLTPMPRAQFFDTAGRPLAGGCVFTYQAGSSTPLASYNNASAAVANPNPTILDSSGRADIWLGAGVAYKITVSAKSVAGGCAAGTTTLYTADNVIDQGFALVKSLQAGTFTIGLRATPVTGQGGGVGVGNAVLSATTAGLYVSVNGGAPVLLSGGAGGGSGTPAGATNQLQYNGGSGFAASQNLVWTNSTNDLVICPAPATGCTANSGVDAPAFSSSATGTAPAFTTASGNFIVQGNGAGLFQNLTVTTTFNSRADTAPNPATTPAIQSSGGDFIIYGDGQAQFQTVRATTTFNSRADTAPSPATTAAFQTQGGDFVIYGDGHGTFQNLTVTTTFNSLATGTTSAIQQANGTFTIKGDGKAYVQYLCTQGNPTTETCAFGLDQNGALTVSSCTGCGSGGAASAAGPTNSVQYNTGSGLGGSANLIWTNAASQLTICNGMGANCTAASGFQAPVFSSSATGTGTAFTTAGGTFTIQANGDGLFQDLTVTKTFNSSATGTTPAIVQSTARFQINGDGNAFFQNICSQGNPTSEACTYGLTAAGVLTVASCVGCTSGGVGQPGAPTNSIQFNNGTGFGGSANLVYSGGNVTLTGGAANGFNAPVFASSATGVSPAFTQTTQRFQLNGDGAAFFQSICTAGNPTSEACTYGLTASGALTVSSCVGCGGAGGAAAGPTGAVQFNGGGAFAGSNNLNWNNTNNVLGIAGSATAGFVGPQFVSSNAGTIAAFANTNGTFSVLGNGTATVSSLSINGGGLTVGSGFYGLTGAGALTVASCSGCPGAPGGPTNAIQYNGGTALAGTANFTWNNGTNIMTIGGNSGGVNAWSISSYASGASIAFNSAQNFQVTGAGDVTGHSFKIAGSGVTYEFLGTNFNVQPNGNVSSNGLIAATNLTATSGGLNVGTNNGAGTAAVATSGLGAQISKVGSNASAAFYDAGGNCTLGTGLAGIGCSSDARLKQNVVPLASGLDKILQLRPVTYQLRSNKNNAVGFIAQDVQPVLPLLIYIDPADTAKYLSLSEIGMIPYMVKALQELAARVAVLEGRR